MSQHTDRENQKTIREQKEDIECTKKAENSEANNAYRISRKGRRN